MSLPRRGLRVQEKWLCRGRVFWQAEVLFHQSRQFSSHRPFRDSGPPPSSSDSSTTSSQTSSNSTSFSAKSTAFSPPSSSTPLKQPYSYGSSPSSSPRSSLSQSRSPFNGKPFISIPSVAPSTATTTTTTAKSTTTFSASSTASTVSASSSVYGTPLPSYPSQSSAYSPFRSKPQHYSKPRITLSQPSSTTPSPPVVFTTNTYSKPTAPSNLSLALINAMLQPVPPPTPAKKPSLLIYKATHPPRHAREPSENQRLYDLEQKKIREQALLNPPPAAQSPKPMKAWFSGELSPAATRSPLQGAEVTSVHTTGDIIRSSFRSTASGRILNPETEAEARMARMKMAKTKEKYLEKTWHSWSGIHDAHQDEVLGPIAKANHPRGTGNIKVPLTRRIRVLSFSKITGVATKDLIKCITKNDLAQNKDGEVDSNTILDMAAQEYLCIEFGKTPELPPSRDVEQTSETGEPRAPVVCIMGHVDHGKTSLLDRLRSTNVVSGEAGGITQSVGAFTVASGAVFLDTPGHAAFSSMRARGADKNMTDIVVLVVASDSGVQPQTIEAIELAQANNVPIVVAITKCDLGADENLLRRQLLRYGLQDESNGGDTLFVRVSAKTGMGMDDLLSALALQAELLDLRAPVNAPSRACVLECSQQQGLGLVVNAVLRSGTISVGDIVVCGTECIRVRALLGERGQKMQSCGPSTPVAVVGFKELDAMGTILRGVASEEEGRVIIAERAAAREARQAIQYEKSLEEAEEESSVNKQSDGPSLRVIVKASTKGSLEAFLKYVNALPQDDLKIQVLKSGVGPIHDGDIHAASMLDAKLFGFGLNVTEAVAEAARQKSVRLYTREIIYQLMDDFKEAIVNELPQVEKHDVVGSAEILQVFHRNGKKKQIIYSAGCKVNSGKLVSRDSKGKIQYRVVRAGVIIFRSVLERLFRFNDEVQSIDKGQECCVVLQDVKEYEIGDVIECVCVTLLPAVFDDSAGRAS